MAKQQWIWFIEPKDDHTNSVLVELEPTENANRLRCNDGVVRPLWECTYATIGEMERSREQKHLCFKVFNRYGPHGAIRECAIYRKFFRKFKDVSVR